MTTYTDISTPGRLRADAAASFERLRAAAKADGFNMGTTSHWQAYRSVSEQAELFLARYAPQSTGSGRYGDVRWYNGHRYVRTSSLGAAAIPGTSNHGSGRALDFQGLGGWGGRGYAWMKANAGRFGWDNDEGKRVNEPWHWVYDHAHDHYAGGGSSAPPKPEVMLDWKWTGVQKMLHHYHGYHGAIDNKAGAGTVTAFQRFLNAHSYRHVAEDGVWGAETCKGSQTWLKARYGYTGAIDAKPGAGTHAAWNRAEAANEAAF